jgi:TonB family protein
MRMSWKLVWDIGRVALLLAFAQSTPSSPSLLAVKLEPPVYPPIAMAARVSGDVDLKITLRPDGTPESVQAESGPQMLKQAAVDSASRSRFQLASGDHAEASYQLVYRFALDKALGCNQERDKSYPHIHYESNTITITEQPSSICDPVADTEPVRVRSVKCLYLWKCKQR